MRRSASDRPPTRSRRLSQGSMARGAHPCISEAAKLRDITALSGRIGRQPKAGPIPPAGHNRTGLALATPTQRRRHVSTSERPIKQLSRRVRMIVRHPRRSSRRLLNANDHPRGPLIGRPRPSGRRSAPYAIGSELARATRPSAFSHPPARAPSLRGDRAGALGSTRRRSSGHAPSPGPQLRRTGSA